MQLPDEEEERKMYWYVKKELEKNNYTHYEISNFAKKGYESKHNMNCWEQKNYIGIGIAAHSYLKNIRFSNTTNLEEYIENIKNNQIEKNRKIEETQTKDEQQKEYMLLGLRKIEGIKVQKFEEKFNKNPLKVFEKEISKLKQEKLIEVKNDKIKLTKKGIDLANLVWEKFI